MLWFVSPDIWSNLIIMMIKVRIGMMMQHHIKTLNDDATSYEDTRWRWRGEGCWKAEGLRWLSACNWLHYITTCNALHYITSLRRWWWGEGDAGERKGWDIISYQDTPKVNDDDDEERDAGERKGWGANSSEPKGISANDTSPTPAPAIIIVIVIIDIVIVIVIIIKVVISNHYFHHQWDMS